MSEIVIAIPGFWLHHLKELKQIDKHQTCLYIIGMTVFLEEINALVQVTTDLLKIDGTAIKVESSGRSVFNK